MNMHKRMSRHLAAIALLLTPCVSEAGTASAQPEDQETETSSDGQAQATARSEANGKSDARSLQGKTYVLFDVDSARLSKSSERLLDQFAKYWRERPDQRIWIIGFADPRGTERHNWLLTFERAKAAMQYLADLGVPKDAMVAAAGGEDTSRAPSRALARRAELALMDADDTRRALRPARTNGGNQE